MKADDCLKSMPGAFPGGLPTPPSSPSLPPAEPAESAERLIDQVNQLSSPPPSPTQSSSTFKPLISSYLQADAIQHDSERTGTPQPYSRQGQPQSGKAASNQVRPPLSSPQAHGSDLIDLQRDDPLQPRVHDKLSRRPHSSVAPSTPSIDKDGNIEMTDAPRFKKQSKRKSCSISKTLRNHNSLRPWETTHSANIREGPNPCHMLFNSTLAQTWSSAFNKLFNKTSTTKRRLEEDEDEDKENENHLGNGKVCAVDVSDALQSPETRNQRAKYAKLGRDPDLGLNLKSPLVLGSQYSVYPSHVKFSRSRSSSGAPQSGTRRRNTRGPRKSISSGNIQNSGSPILEPINSNKSYETHSTLEDGPNKTLTDSSQISDLTERLTGGLILEPLRQSRSDEDIGTGKTKSHSTKEEIKSAFPEYDEILQVSQERQSIEAKKKQQEAETKARFLEIPNELFVEVAARAAKRDHGLAAEKIVPLVSLLSNEWQKKVNKVQQTKDQYADITESLNRHDFGTLVPYSSSDGNGWLNDVIIADYLKLVVKKGCEMDEKASSPDILSRGPRYFTFNSHLYAKWSSSKQADPYNEITRWITRAKLGGTKFLQAEMVFIPIHKDSHWTLLVISGSQKTITYYDSMGGPHKRYTKFALNLLAGTLKENFKEDEWKVQVGQSTQQTNGLDCGVFVCMNALALLRGFEPSKALNAEDIPAARQQIAATLLNNGFSGDLDF